MKPFTLTGTSPDGHVGEVWACGECMRTAYDEGAATTCCEPYKCKECGVLTERFWTICKGCRKAKDDAQEQKLIEAATVVQYADYDHGYVCIGDDSFQDVDDWEMDGEPAWAWACKPAEKLRLDAVHVLEGPLQEYHEDAIDSLDVDGLQKLLDDWCEAQHRMTTWFQEDRTRRVVLPLPPGPCANCGHTEYHCPAGGCNAVIDGEWCECEGYAPIPKAEEGTAP